MADLLVTSADVYVGFALVFISSLMLLIGLVVSAHESNDEETKV